MRNHMAAGWFYSPPQITKYFATRIWPSLRPPKGVKLINPYKALAQLNSHHWLMFWVGFLGWTWDAFDFFTVSLCVTEIAKDFGVKNSDVTWGLTLTLMLRSVGALIFGTMADRYGRKWPMIINLVLFIILELGSGFTHSLGQFLGVRALYGIAMGGMFGPAAATALEDLPYEARGILSGLYQQGYGVGYLLASAFYRALVPTTTHGWRSLFWFGAGPPVLIIAFRLCLGETNYFQILKAEREMEHKIKMEHQAHGEHVDEKGTQLKAFLQSAWVSVKENWVLLIYMFVVMSGFNSVSHGSQDLFPTYLKDQLGFNASQVTIVSCVGQIGAVIGGTTVGWISSMTGRRLAMCTACIIGGSLVPAYIFTKDMSVTASCFFEQIFVGGVWGPIPIHLMELAPPGLRTLVVGLTYQLGNLASSASATIEAVIGERYPLPPAANGTSRYDYGRVIGIFLGAVWAYILFFLILGPEMTQEEREERAQEAKEFEELRLSGASLAEIGAQRIRTKESKMEHIEQVDEDPEGKEEEKAAEMV